MNGSRDHDVLALAEEIAGYLEQHPDAADTLEGILTWWLARQRYAQAKESVERALELLRAQGQVRISEGALGRIYSSTKRKP